MSRASVVQSLLQRVRSATFGVIRVSEHPELLEAEIVKLETECAAACKEARELAAKGRVSPATPRKPVTNGRDAAAQVGR